MCVSIEPLKLMANANHHRNKNSEWYKVALEWNTSEFKHAYKEKNLPKKILRNGMPTRV